MSSPWAGCESWTNLGSWRCWLHTATCSLLGSCSLVAEARVLRTLGLYLAARPLQDAWRQQMEKNLKGLLAVQLSGLAAPAATAVEEAESKKSLRTGAVGHTCPQSPAQQCVEHDQQKCSGSHRCCLPCSHLPSLIHHQGACAGQTDPKASFAFLSVTKHCCSLVYLFIPWVQAENTR